MRLIKVFFLLLLSLGVLVACADEGDPAETTENYLRALADRDVDELLSLTCAEQDPQVQLRVDSFPAGATISDMTCTRDDDRDSSAVVSCDGNFVWTYDGQDNQRPLGNWQLSKEDDEWRVCGNAP